MILEVPAALRVLGQSANEPVTATVTVTGRNMWGRGPNAQYFPSGRGPVNGPPGVGLPGQRSVDLLEQAGHSAAT